MMDGFGFGNYDGSFSERISKWHPEVIEAARRNAEAFKRYRHLLIGDVYHLAPQGPSGEALNAPLSRPRSDGAGSGGEFAGEGYIGDPAYSAPD